MKITYSKKIFLFFFQFLIVSSKLFSIEIPYNVFHNMLGVGSIASLAGAGHSIANQKYKNASLLFFGGVILGSLVGRYKRKNFKDEKTTSQKKFFSSERIVWTLASLQAVAPYLGSLVAKKKNTYTNAKDLSYGIVSAATLLFVSYSSLFD